MSAARLFAVVPAAGIGSRVGGERPKQYQSLAGQPVLQHSLTALLACPAIEQIVVALRAHDHWADSVPALGDRRVRRVVGGAERADSVLAGLCALATVGAPHDWVLVHDAARPCLQRGDLERLISRSDACGESGEGAILAQPVVDTLKQAGDDGRVIRTIDRRRLWRAQTPQMFRLGELRRALEQALAAGEAVTDEASAMERVGHAVQLVAGAASNLKVTLPEDLALAAFYLAEAAGNAQAVTAPGPH